MPLQASALAELDDPSLNEPAPDPAEALLLSLFRSLDESGTAYCILRNYEGLPERAGNDVDFLIAAGAHARFETCLAAAAHGVEWRIVSHKPLAGVTKYVLCGDAAHGAPRVLRIDATDSLSWHGIAWGDPGFVLRTRRRREPFWIPRPGAEAAVSLVTRWLAWGEIKEAYRRTIRDGAASDPEAFTAVLARGFGDRMARVLRDRAAAGDWEGLARLRAAARRQRLGRALGRRFLRNSWGWLRAVARRARATFLRPTGFFLVLIGPDGSGKSTVTAGLRTSLAPLFPVEKCYHAFFKLLPELKELRTIGLRTAGRRPPAAPPPGSPPERDARPHGLLRALAYVFYYALDFVLGHGIVVRARGAGELVTFDRYFYDYYLQPAFQRVPRRLLRALIALLPRPDLVVYLHNRPETIHARKPELSVAEIAAQESACADLVGRLRGAATVETSGDAEDTVRAVTQLVVACMAARWAGVGAAATAKRESS